MDVGYSSQDPPLLRKQIQQARRMGIAAFVVDWYGESRPYSDHNFALLQEAASESHFQVALLYNEAEDQDSEATDSAARQVAALENSAAQLEQPTGRGAGQVDIVKAILWDLAQSEFQVESSRLAEVVHDSMTQTLRISNRGVKQAGFYVLGGAAMPAVLLEIGFVTNPREERKLKDTKYRDEIARAIFSGLAEYKRAWDQRARASAETPAVSRTR